MCWHDRLVVEMEEVGPLRDADVVINFTLSFKGRSATSPIDEIEQPIGWPPSEGRRCDMAGACRLSSEVVRRVFSPTAAAHAGWECMARRFCHRKVISIVSKASARGSEATRSCTEADI